MVGVLLGAMMFGYLADRSVLGKPKSWAKLGLGPLAGFKARVAGLSARLWLFLRSSEDCSWDITLGSSTPLLCSSAWVPVVLRPLTQVFLPDRLGRRKVLILNYLQTAVSGTCAAYAPNYTVYCIFRLLSGMSLASIAINCMTLSEDCSPCPLSTPSPASLLPKPSPSEPHLLSTQYPPLDLHFQSTLTLPSTAPSSHHLDPLT